MTAASTGLMPGTPANLKGQAISQTWAFVSEGIQACIVKVGFLSDMWQRSSDKPLFCFHAASETPSKGANLRHCRFRSSAINSSDLFARSVTPIVPHTRHDGPPETEIKQRFHLAMRPHRPSLLLGTCFAISPYCYRSGLRKRGRPRLGDEFPTLSGACT